jgi:ATP-dependent RNA helicase RhlE
MTFAELGLKPELLRALTDAGYKTPTPIQEQAIPVVRGGRDVLGCARTGTGKTAAFLLPILERLSAHPGGRRPRVLVLTPTRELAAQIGDSAREYGKYLPAIRTATIFGGVGMMPQTEKLRRGVDLVIATPGRLLDHLGRSGVSFADLEVLVLDEADRMLDMGFLPDVKRILAVLKKERQNLFFSATMPSEIEDLIKRTLREPVVIEVTPRSSTVRAVKQVVHHVSGENKRDLLCHLLKSRDMTQVLVFTRTKVRADRLAKHLVQTGRRVAAIHGNKSQGARTAALGGFKSGRIDTLVATDIAARGIDVDGISHVVNFDVPNVPEDYVHRIGRTARADAEGSAISLVSAEETGFVRAIEKLIGMRIPNEVVAGFHAAPVTHAPVHVAASAGRPAAPGFRPAGVPRPSAAPRGERAVQRSYSAGGYSGGRSYGSRPANGRRQAR